MQVISGYCVFRIKNQREHMGDKVLGDEFWATNHIWANSDEIYHRSGNQV